MKKLAVLALGVFVAACGETAIDTAGPEVAGQFVKPSLDVPQDARTALGRSEVAGGQNAKAEAERVTLQFFNGVVEEYYSFEAEVDEGEVLGQFSVKAYFVDDGEVLEDFVGTVTCAGFDPDGKTARFGGITEDGRYALWTVVDGGDNDDADGIDGLSDDLTTDLRYGESEFVRDFHCAVGFPPSAFGLSSFSTCDIDPDTDLCRFERGEIKVEAGS